MRPPGAAQDAGHGAETDTELVGECSLAGPSRSINPADAPDPCSIQSYARSEPSSFCVHIRDVVGIGAEEQMAGPHACRVVALMADVHPDWDRPFGQFPREPVSFSLLVADLYPAIAKIVYAWVNPATALLNDILPEPLIKRPLSAGVRAQSTTEAAISTRDVGRSGLKGFAAEAAIHSDAGSSHVWRIAWLGVASKVVANV